MLDPETYVQLAEDALELAAFHTERAAEDPTVAGGTYEAALAASHAARAATYASLANAAIAIHRVGEPR